MWVSNRVLHKRAQTTHVSVVLAGLTDVLDCAAALTKGNDTSRSKVLVQIEEELAISSE
jgi:hypothetical protein